MAQDVHVARQAIYDRANNVVAYELLFRALPDENSSCRNDDLASWQVLSAGFLDIGLDALLKGRRALVNVPRKMLLDERIYSLPPDVIGLEILEDVEPDEEVLAMCRSLRARGFLVVLDDYVGQPVAEPMLDVIDWVKVDLRSLSAGEAAKLARQLKRRKLRLLAEKVETQAERDMALAAGYDYLQGYFLHRPRVIGGRTLPSSVNAKLKLLRLLSSREFNLNQVKEIIESDVALCYRLVQYSNSARFGARREITGLRQCLMRLGEDETRRWITIVLLPTLAKGRCPEITENALARARMSELLTTNIKPKIHPSEAFMAGMFSLLDAVLQLPMTDVVQQLGLCGEVSDALLHRGESDLRALVQLVESYEAVFSEELLPLCRQLGISLDDTGNAYLEALHWASEVNRPVEVKEAASLATR
ncbi:MAG: HDOD domain-containing protein [Acidobacteria bacterium]|nr:HDOD domain-containing protein [Acidobacteriota bacterium]